VDEIGLVTFGEESVLGTFSSAEADKSKYSNTQ
jgi:hypothetical protein